MTLTEAIKNYLQQNPGSGVKEIASCRDVILASGPATGLSRICDGLCKERVLYYHPADRSLPDGKRVYYAMPSGWSCSKCRRSQRRKPSAQNPDVCSYCNRAADGEGARQRKQSSSPLDRNEMMYEWSMVALVPGDGASYPTLYGLMN